ncbi:MAG: hypothetical protein ACFB4J_04310 [Elainellaceae cyanobacterium]
MPLTQDTANSITAFIDALAQQDNALPEGLQKQLHAIGQNLNNRAIELPVIAASLPALNQAYQKALASPPSDNQATLVSATNQSPSDELLERASEVFTDPNPVQAAQRKQSSPFGQMASNPLKRLFNRG